jgi:hypothetical protein
VCAGAYQLHVVVRLVIAHLALRGNNEVKNALAATCRRRSAFRSLIQLVADARSAKERCSRRTTDWHYIGTGNKPQSGVES